MNRLLEIARRDGIKAAMSNLPESINPFAKSTRLGAAWIAGYRYEKFGDAQSENTNNNTQQERDLLV
jgi:hypothetical protein